MNIRCEDHNCKKTQTCLCYVEKDAARAKCRTLARWPFPYPKGTQGPACLEYEALGTAPRQQEELPL